MMIYNMTYRKKLLQAITVLLCLLFLLCASACSKGQESDREYLLITSAEFCDANYRVAGTKNTQEYDQQWVAISDVMEVYYIIPEKDIIGLASSSAIIMTQPENKEDLTTYTVGDRVGVMGYVQTLDTEIAAYGITHAEYQPIH